MEKKETKKTKKSRLKIACKEIDKLYLKSEKATNLDAKYDAGEWSSPLHAKDFEVKLLKILAKHELSQDDYLDWIHDNN